MASSTNLGLDSKMAVKMAHFSLRMLHNRHHHNLPIVIMLADLVKAFNTANHEFLLKILVTNRGLPKSVSAIKRMYENIVVILILEKSNTAINFTPGVKQGDNMVLVLFLFLVMELSKTLVMG